MEPPPTGASTLGSIFFQRVVQLGDRTFIKLQRGAKFEEISWRDFGVLVERLTLALCAVGLARGDTVAILGENSLPWLCADLATIAGGWTNVVVAPSVSDTLLIKILSHA